MSTSVTLLISIHHPSGGAGPLQGKKCRVGDTNTVPDIFPHLTNGGNTQGGTGLAYTVQQDLQTLTVPRLEGAHVGKDWLTGRGTAGRCSETQDNTDGH